MMWFRLVFTVVFQVVKADSDGSHSRALTTDPIPQQYADEQTMLPPGASQGVVEQTIAGSSHSRALTGPAPNPAEDSQQTGSSRSVWTYPQRAWKSIGKMVGMIPPGNIKSNDT